jgi:site-specific DNA-methyltransferase (adenine-specific)
VLNSENLTLADGRATLLLGDSLDILPRLPPASFKAVVTDPPYFFPTQSTADKGNGFPDMDNAARWYALWLSSAKALLNESGYAVVFGSWRTQPVLYRAGLMAGLFPASCLIWDKQGLGTASPRQLRPCYELALFFAMPAAKIKDRRSRDIHAAPWPVKRETRHPAEKPVKLMQWIIERITEPGDAVLDPFMGAATIAVAALNCGRTFTGVELNPDYFEMATRRLATTAPVNLKGNQTSPHNPQCHPVPRSFCQFHLYGKKRYQRGQQVHAVRQFVFVDLPRRRAQCHPVPDSQRNGRHVRNALAKHAAVDLMPEFSPFVAIQESAGRLGGLIGRLRNGARCFGKGVVGIKSNGRREPEIVAFVAGFGYVFHGALLCFEMFPTPTVTRCGTNKASKTHLKKPDFIYLSLSHPQTFATYAIRLQPVKTKSPRFIVNFPPQLSRAASTRTAANSSIEFLGDRQIERLLHFIYNLFLTRGR